MKKLTMLAACAVAVAACASRRKEPQTQLALDVPIDIGIAIADEDQELPEDWESRFDPPGGTMNVDDDEPGFFGALGFQPEFRQYVGSGWIVGALAKYQFYIPGGIDQIVSKDTVHWWNPVTLQTISLRRSPSAGLLIGKNAIQEQQFRLHVTSFYYSLAVVDYRGVDNPGGKNTSRETDRHDIANGFGFGIGLDYRLPDANYGRLGFFLDHASTAWSFGIGWRFTVPMAASESTVPVIE